MAIFLVVSKRYQKSGRRKGGRKEPAPTESRQIDAEARRRGHGRPPDPVPVRERLPPHGRKRPH